MVSQGLFIEDLAFIVPALHSCAGIIDVCITRCVIVTASHSVVHLQAPRILKMPQAAAKLTPPNVGGGAPGVPAGLLQLLPQLPLQPTLQVLMLTLRGSMLQPQSQQAQQRMLPMFKALRPGKGALLQSAKQLVQRLLKQMMSAHLPMQTQVLLQYRVMRQKRDVAPKYRARR